MNTVPISHNFPHLDKRLFFIVMSSFLVVEGALFVGAIALGHVWLTIAIAGAALFVLMAFFHPEIALFLCLAMVYSVVSATYLSGLFKVTVLFAATVLTLSRLYLKEPLVTDDMNKVAAVFTVITIASLAYVDSMELGLESLLEFFKALILFVLAANLLRNKQAVRISFWVIVLAAGYVASSNLYDLARNPLSFAGRLRGLFGDPNNLAMVLVSAVPICYALLRCERNFLLRMGATVLGALIVAAVFPTVSRGGMLALGAVLIAILYKERKNRVIFWMGVSAIILGAAIFYYKFGFGFELVSKRVSSVDKSLLQRYRLYRGGIAMFFAHPFFGVGVGNFLVHSKHYTHLITRLYAHNMYIHVAAELGVFALTLFVSMILLSLIRLEKIQRRVTGSSPVLLFQARGVQLSIMAMAISGMFLSQHFNKILWMLLGMSVAILHMQVQTSSE